MQNIHAYYINMFRDRKGNIVSSEDGAMNTEAKALNEAIEYVLDFGWEYIDTLSNHSYPINFREQILDEEFNRANPDSEWSRKQWNQIHKQQREEITGKKT